MAEYQKVVDTPELGPGEKVGVEAHGESIVVLNVGQTYYALQARCPNDGTDLATEGRLDGDRLTCPSDGWVYEVRTGRRVDPPDGAQLRRFALKVEGNAVLIGPELAAQ